MSEESTKLRGRVNQVILHTAGPFREGQAVTAAWT
jgi:hypothetical protein